MNSDGSKVGLFDINLNLNNSYSNNQKAIIERAAQSCPIGNSLHTNIMKTYTFNY